MEVADRICREGFDPCVDHPLRFVEHASACRSTKGAPSCLLFVRVMLGECLEVVPGSGAPWATHRPFIEEGAAGYVHNGGHRGNRFDSVRVAASSSNDSCALGEELLDHPVYVVYSVAQALPLFRVHCSHDVSCCCC